MATLPPQGWLRDDPRARRRRSGKGPYGLPYGPQRRAGHGGRRGGSPPSARGKRLRPDVCLLDIRMPFLDGLESRAGWPDGCRRPAVRVVVTTFDLDEYVYGALKAGACGFLSKDSAHTSRRSRPRRRRRCADLPSVTVRLLQHLAAPLASRRTSRTGHRARTRRCTPRRSWPHQRGDRP
jgi:chemotaxis response regulator CheB